MKILTGLRATGRQKLSTTASNGDTIDLVLYFHSRTAAWYLDVSSGTFSVKGVRISRVYNLLEQYSNIIPFGVGIIISDDGEPFLINDFSTGRVRLAILSPDEVVNIDNVYVGIKNAG